MSPEARELHRKRGIVRNAKRANPQPFKMPPGRKTADWIPAALSALWTFVYSPWKFKELEKINNVFRTKSLERRVAIAKVLQVMFYHKDAQTLWVAYPDDEAGRFVGRGMDFLVRETELTPCAVKGALKDLRTAGLIETFRQRMRLLDGSTAPAYAIRVLRQKLFDLFAVAHRMKQARKEACSKFIDDITPLISRGKTSTSWLLRRFEVAQSILLDPALEVTPTSALLP